VTLRRRSCLALLVALVAACSDSTPSTPSPSPAPSVDAGVPDAAPAIDAAPEATDYDRLVKLQSALSLTPDDAGREALVESFVREVAYGPHGFPIRASGKLAVVVWDPKRTAGSLSLVGDFNAWSVSASPLLPPVAGFPFYVRVEADPAPSARSIYKLLRAGTEYFADPLARRFAHDANGEHSLLEAGTARGHLERWPTFGEGRGSLAPRTLLAWLPPHYDESTASYPLLVMHDGQNLFGTGGANGSWHADDAAEQGVASGAVRPFVLVGIPSTAARFDEYTHVQDALPGIGTVGGQADAYAAFVTQGIVPFVRARYRLRAEPAQTAVLGSSLGGLVSLYIGRKHQPIFGFAGAMSGTTSWGSIGLSNPTIRDLYVQAPPVGLSIYLDSGGDDGGGCAGLSASDSEQYHDQYCETVKLRDTLTGLGWKLGTDLGYAWAPGAAHDEAEWAKRFPSVLRDWFPRK
jgi:hypothetical protein